MTESSNHLWVNINMRCIKEKRLMTSVSSQNEKVSSTWIVDTQSISAEFMLIYPEATEQKKVRTIAHVKKKK